MTNQTLQIPFLHHVLSFQGLRRLCPMTQSCISNSYMSFGSVLLRGCYCCAHATMSREWPKGIPLFREAIWMESKSKSWNIHTCEHELPPGIRKGWWLDNNGRRLWAEDMGLGSGSSLANTFKHRHLRSRGTLHSSLSFRFFVNHIFHDEIFNYL